VKSLAEIRIPVTACLVLQTIGEISEP
jgi:hypothetical protein